MSGHPRILIAEGETLTAAAIQSLLESQYEVCGSVRNGLEMQRAAKSLRPDVIVLEIDLPYLNGIDAGEEIKRVLPSVKLVYLTTHKQASVCAEALRRGASGYLLKESSSEELLAAIHSVLLGGTFITTLITRQTVEFMLTSPKAFDEGGGLTSREIQVLKLLARGYTMKKVSDILGIRSGTVAFHKYKAMRSLGLTTNAQLLRYVMQQAA